SASMIHRGHGRREYDLVIEAQLRSRKSRPCFSDTWHIACNNCHMIRLTPLRLTHILSISGPNLQAWSFPPHRRFECNNCAKIQENFENLFVPSSHSRLSLPPLTKKHATSAHPPSSRIRCFSRFSARCHRRLAFPMRRGRWDATTSFCPSHQ